MPSRQCRPIENPFWYDPSQGPPGQRKDQRARSARVPEHALLRKESIRRFLNHSGPHSFRRGLSGCRFQRRWIEIGPDLFDLAVDDAKEIEDRHHRAFVSWQHECGFPKRRNALAFYHMALNLGFVNGIRRNTRVRRNSAAAAFPISGCSGSSGLMSTRSAANGMRSISLLTSPSRNACTARSFCSLLSDPMCRFCAAPRHETPMGRCRFRVNSVGIVGCCEVSLSPRTDGHCAVRRQALCCEPGFDRARRTASAARPWMIQHTASNLRPPTANSEKNEMLVNANSTSRSSLSAS